MNERIKELAEQARQYANSMYPSGLDIPKWGPAYHEKFAELIVEECTKVIDRNLFQNIGWNTSRAVRRHFGIDQVDE